MRMKRPRINRASPPKVEDSFIDMVHQQFAQAQGEVVHWREPVMWRQRYTPLDLWNRCVGPSKVDQRLP